MYPYPLARHHGRGGGRDVPAGKPPAVKSYAGINQNYAWGQDSWRLHRVMATLKPEATITSFADAQVRAGQYGPEISACCKPTPM